MRYPTPKLQCLGFKRLLIPYATGELSLHQPRAYERLRQHLRACTRCRAEVQACATTHYKLSTEARRVRTGESSIAMGANGSVADRVILEVTALEERSRLKQTAGRRLAFAMSTLAVLLMLIMQPSHAREWIYGKLFGLPPKVAITQPLHRRHRSKPAPFPNRDPFAVGVDLQPVQPSTGETP